MLPKTIARFVKPLLILAAPLLTGLLVFKNGADFPVLDEWDGTAPRHAAAVACECTIAFLQKMVDHLGFPFLVRTVAIFLGLRTTAQSSTNLVVSGASDHGYRIYSPLFRRPL